MLFFNSIFKFLFKPFPEDERKSSAYKKIALVSLFAFLFLYVFEPFGLASLESNKPLICLGFGLATFFASVLFELSIGLLLKKKYNNESWTFLIWIFYNLGIMLFISLGNFLYARMLIFGYIDWSLLPHMVYGVFTIGVIPTVAIGAWSLLRQEKKHQGIAKEVSPLSIEYDLPSTVHNDLLFDIPIHQIKYIEALQNYAKLVYVKPNGQMETHTARASLKHILEVTKGSSIIKCHRSFLVNNEAIDSAEGNAQGLLLTLTECEITVPVSRSYVNEFKRK